MHTCMPICHQPAQLGAPAWPCSTSALRWFCAQISTNAWIPVSSAWQRLTGDQLSLRRCHTSWSKWTSTLKNQRFTFYMFFKPPNGICVIVFLLVFPDSEIHQRRKNHQLRCPNSLTRCLATLLSELACEQLLLELLALLRQLLGGLARENTLVFPHVFPNHGSKWWRNQWGKHHGVNANPQQKIAHWDQSWKIHIKTIQDPYIGLQLFTWDILSGWWLTYPSEKYEFVNGKDYTSHIWNGKKSHVPNHHKQYICYH